MLAAASLTLAAVEKQSHMKDLQILLREMSKKAIGKRIHIQLRNRGQNLFFSNNLALKQIRWTSIRVETQIPRRRQYHQFEPRTTPIKKCKMPTTLKITSTKKNRERMSTMRTLSLTVESRSTRIKKLPSQLHKHRVLPPLLVWSTRRKILNAFNSRNSNTISIMRMKKDVRLRKQVQNASHPPSHNLPVTSASGLTQLKSISASLVTKAFQTRKATTRPSE